MRKTPILLTLGLALATLSGCVDGGGPGYVESRLVNEGPVGAGGYRAAPVYATGPGYRSGPAYRPAPSYRSTIVVDSGPRYSNRGVYRDPYRSGGYDPRQNRYDRDPYYNGGDGRGSYRDRYCDDVGYQDPRCD